MPRWPLAALLALFDATFVLCAGAGTERDNCARHRGASYWPASLSVDTFEGPRLDAQIIAHHGEAIKWVLGQTRADPTLTRKGDDLHLKGARHRIRTLLAHLELVRIASRRGLQSVFILEADVRPLGGTRSLRPDELMALGTWLRHGAWQVVRASGLYRDFSSSYRKPPSVCPRACKCKPVIPGAERRVCETAAPIAADDGTAPLMNSSRAAGAICDVRDTVAYGVSAAAFPTFLRARARALATIQSVYQAHDRGRLPLTNSSFGLEVDGYGAPVGLPWIDIWLPAAFRSLHLLPSMAVQHIKQYDAQSSAAFAAKCQQNDTSQASRPTTWRTDGAASLFWPAGDGGCRCSDETRCATSCL